MNYENFKSPQIVILFILTILFMNACGVSSKPLRLRTHTVPQAENSTTLQSAPEKDVSSETSNSSSPVLTNSPVPSPQVPTPIVILVPPPFPPPQLTCQVVRETSSASIAVDQQGSPRTRSSEVRYSVTASRLGNYSTSVVGPQPFSGNSVSALAVVGTFASSGNFRVTLSISDSTHAGDSLYQATCSDPDTVTVSAVSPATHLIYVFADVATSTNFVFTPATFIDANWRLVGGAFNLYLESGLCSIPIHTCYTALGRWYLAQNVTCNGSGTNGGLLGYACAGQYPGTAPLIEYNIGQSFYSTTNPDSVPGWAVVGLLGYVP